MTSTGKSVGSRARKHLAAGRPLGWSTAWMALLLLVAAPSLWSQTTSKTGVLRGTVMDKETGETLPGVSVTVVGTYFAAVTDGK